MIPQDKKFYKKYFPKTRKQWLKKVSRTFALSIKILPGDLKNIFGHSYLLCRLLDTIEDAPKLSIKKKREALDMAIKSIKSSDNIKKSDRYFLLLSQNTPLKEEEKNLLTNSHFIFECLYTFDLPIKRIIEHWTCEMAEGMKKYCFGTDSNIKQLSTLEDLDKYTYYVAGTVGKLLTDLISLDKFNISPENCQILDSTCIQFGKALQMVNITKDSRSDKLDGRCYIPKEMLQSKNLNLQSFFNPQYKSQIIIIYNELIAISEEYLIKAQEYICALPIRHFRYRLACIWTVLFAHRTLSNLKKELNGFIQGSSIYKITRKDLKKIIFSSIPAAFSNRYFKKQIHSNKIS